MQYEEYIANFIEKTDKRLNENDSKLQAHDQSLYGDNHIDKGFTGKCEDIEQRLKKLEDKYQFVLGWICAFNAILGFCILILSIFVKFFIK